MRAPLSVSPWPPCMLQWASPHSFLPCPALPHELRAALASAAPGCQCPDRNGAGGPGPGIQGPRSDLRMGMRVPGVPQPPLSPPSSHTHSSSRPAAVRPEPIGAGGRAAELGLCLVPRGSLLLPPPALPEPGRVPPAHRAPLCSGSGGGRRTVPELGTALTLTLLHPFPGQRSGFLPWSLRGRSSSSVATSLGNMGATQGWGPLFSPPPTQDPSPAPGTAASCKNTPLSPPDKPCPLLSAWPPALPSSLYLSP